MSDQLPVMFGSEWEKNVYIALLKHKAKFEYQVAFFGGRRLRGGTVIDFVVYPASDPIALYVDGPYWHRNRKVDDQMIRARLEKMGYMIMAVKEESQTEEQAYEWVKENIPR